MSPGAPGAIGPVSVRYAAQIRELLQVQAVQRMAADQEAARASAEAERTASVEASAKAAKDEPLHTRVEAPNPAPRPEPVKPAEVKPEAPAATHLVDIQA